MKVKVSLVIALGLFLASVGPLFACSSCNFLHAWCDIDPDGLEYCFSDGVPDENPTDGTFCMAYGRVCDNWIPQDCTYGYVFVCNQPYVNIKYDPCSQDSGSSES